MWRAPRDLCWAPFTLHSYINDKCNTSDKLTFCLFADDTSQLYTHNNVDEAIRNLNMELVKLCKWLLANKLCINVLKSNYIIVCAYQFKYTQSVPLILNNAMLSQVKQKTLGITINENLSWKNHIDEVATKISKNIGIMNRSKNNLPNSILLL